MFKNSSVINRTQVVNILATYQFLVGGNNIVVAVEANNLIDVKHFLLTRVQGTSASLNGQTDYPVSSITINDGNAVRTTYFDYNLTTATIDPSGNTAQYNEVTVSPDNNVTKPYGSTKTFFYNGLITTGGYLPSIRLTGLPYSTIVLDKNGNTVSNQSITYFAFSKEINNATGNQIETGYFIRPINTYSTIDGITSSTYSDYDITTGILKSNTQYNLNSKGTSNTISTYYTYFWEKYDPTKSLNIINPVIQTKSTITTPSGTQTATVSATTWKKWGTNAIWAPHKSYAWKRTGSSDFDFTNWSNTGEPPTDWIKASEINSIDVKGNISQITTR